MYIRIPIIILLCIISMTSFAQSMTDTQVLNYIRSEQERGTSQQQIGMALIKRGVTTTQLHRIRKAYQQSLKEEEVRPKAENNPAQLYTQPTEADGKSLYENLNADSLATDAVVDENVKQVFGRNIFNQHSLTFQPGQNIATPTNYRLGAGDNITIEVWGSTQQTFTKTISADGNVTIEGVGPIHLAGLSVSQANAQLKASLGRYYSATSIQMSLNSSRSIQVQVLGEVKTPGTYTISSLSTAFNALYTAGGISELGTLRDIKVYRGGRQIASIDVYDYLLHGNSQGDVALRDNDIIIVGTYDCIVNVQGAVKRPMYYEMKSNETVGSLLNYAGGFTGEAFSKSITLTRKSGYKRSVHTVDEFLFSSFTLTDADSIFVSSSLEEFSNRIEIKGCVERPGVFELGASVNTLRELITIAGGLKPEAFTTRVIIHRMREDRTLEVLSTNVESVMNGSSPDIALCKDDVVFVPSKLDMRGEQKLNILGAVNFPGEYPYAEGTTIEDLIIQAGGLTDHASVVKVDVNRRILDPKATEKSEKLTENFTLSLKEGFVIDGEPGFELKPFDQVVVRNSPLSAKQENVTVQGAVNFDGTYAMSHKGYSLSDLINDAGGISSLGFARGARLTRTLSTDEILARKQNVRSQQIELLETAIRDGESNPNITLTDSLLSLKMAGSETYLVSIDLEKALAKPHSVDDVELRVGDVLYVPQYSSTVRISGSVNYPISVPYVNGKSLKYYIERAGGYDDNARKNRVYSIGMNGVVTKLSSSSHKGITPGCEIVIPTNTRKHRKMTTAEVMSIGSTSASMAAVIATICNMLK